MYRTTTVVTPATNTDLTTLTNVKMDLNITDTSNDIYLQRQIKIASSAIVAYTNRTFALQTYRDEFRSFWGPLWAYGSSWNQGAIWSSGAATGFGLLLANVPVVSLSSIDEDGTTLISSDYYLDANVGGSLSDAGILYRLDGGGVREGWSFDTLQVTYTAGWSLPGDVSPTLPAEIEQAAILMVIAARQAGRLTYTDRDPFLRSEIVEGIGRRDYSQTAIGSSTSASVGSMPQMALDLLAPYCIPIVA